MKKLSLFSFLLITMLSSCEREDPEFVGPSLVNVFGDFYIIDDLEISDRNIDFTSEEDVVFTATFSKEVDWELHITGEESGAHKLIQGFSSQLDAGNASWNGSTTNLPLFKAEACMVELIILSDSSFTEDALTVDGINSIPSNGFLVADFEGEFNSEWTTVTHWGDSGMHGVSNELVSAQGDYYYHMAGLITWPEWLVGLIEFHKEAYGEESYNTLNQDPAAVYFNMMVNATEGAPSSDVNKKLIKIEIREDDNGNGSWESNEDIFELEFTGLDPGWQLISLPYTDIPGEGVREPHKIQSIVVMWLAKPQLEYSGLLLDYVVLTENGPLVP